MHSPHSRPSKWVFFAVLMMVASVATSQIRLQDDDHALCYAAMRPANEFAGFHASEVVNTGYLKYRYGHTKYRDSRPHVWDFVCFTGLSVGFIGFAVADPGDFAAAIVAGLAGSNTPYSNPNPVKPSYLTTGQYNTWNLIMVGGMTIALVAGIADLHSLHRYAFGEKPNYMERLCYTRQGYARFHIAGSGNQVGLGISL